MLPCGNQHHCLDNLHLKAFLWSCLPYAQELRECSGLFTGLLIGGRSVLCYGRLGDDTIVSCEGKILVGVSILPLICWQGPEDGNKAVSAEIPVPVAATPRRADSTTLDSKHPQVRALQTLTEGRHSHCDQHQGNCLPNLSLPTKEEGEVWGRLVKQAVCFTILLHYGATDV